MWVKKIKVKLDDKNFEKIHKTKNDCVNCKKCYNVCPMMKEYSNSPKELLDKILETNEFLSDMAYSCMDCGLCEKVCPKNIDLKKTFYDLKVLSFEKNVKPKGYKSVKFHQVNSFSKVFCTSHKKTSKKVFLPGCSLSSYSEKLVLNVFNYLNKNLDNVSLFVKCCGKPTKSIGDIKTFNKYFESLMKDLTDMKVDEVIVACPNCYNTIKNNSNLKVTFIYEIITKYGLDYNLKNHYNDLEVKFTLHDPCSIRYESQIHNDVRKILDYIGLNVFEFDNNKENTECCGAGGMLKLTNPKISDFQSSKRANDSKTEYIVSYCESCCEVMICQNKKTLHILDFLFNEKVFYKNVLTQNKENTLKKWIKRRKSSRM